MDLDSKIAGILMEVIPWVDRENRQEMLKSLTGKLGTEAAELVSHLYQIHQVNKTGD